MGFPPLPQPPQEQAPPPNLQPAPQRPPVEPDAWVHQSWDPQQYRKARREEQRSALKRILKQFGAGSSLMLFIYLGLAWVVLIFMSPDIMNQLYVRTTYLYIITPSLVPILNIGGAALVAYFILLALAITISYFYTMGESTVKTLGEIADGEPRKHSTILTIGGLVFAILLIDFVYYIILQLAGVSTNAPNFGAEPFWASVFGFAQASVWEEIITRVLLIGVPLLWIDLLLRRKALLPAHRYFMGGGMKLSPVVVVLIIFSAIMFGFGHLQNWDIWKVAPTIILGLCFGYLFTTIGLYAAIMFHFAFNFLSVPLNYFSATGSVVFLLLYLVWLAAGVMFVAYYGMRLWRFAVNDLFGAGKPEQQTPQN